MNNSGVTGDTEETGDTGLNMPVSTPGVIGDTKETGLNMSVRGLKRLEKQARLHIIVRVA